MSPGPRVSNVAVPTGGPEMTSLVSMTYPPSSPTLTAKLFNGVRLGVLIAESIHPNKAHIGGLGINQLTGAHAVAPHGGAAFHDNKVWIRKAQAAG